MQAERCRVGEVDGIMDVFVPGFSLCFYSPNGKSYSRDPLSGRSNGSDAGLPHYPAVEARRCCSPSEFLFTKAFDSVPVPVAVVSRKEQ